VANVVVLGGQWGDEGKGKIVDLLTEKVPIVARYQGGSNAGHTVVVEGHKHKLHHIPSGIVRAGVDCVIGNGVVVDPESLLGEIQDLEGAGIQVEGRLHLSGRAHLVLPYHKQMEKVFEEKLGADRIGTTLRGVGPAYEGKAARLGLRILDLGNETVLRARLEAYLATRYECIDPAPDETGGELDRVVETYIGFGRQLKPYIDDTSAYLNRRMDAGDPVLFEGAQGTMLDLDHGTYPFVTSSSSTVGGVCSGLGVAPTRIDAVLGVFKAYCTRVGSGPFPTEDRGSYGDNLRERGHEYGTTTGRPRRCGWFDTVAARYARMLNRFDAVAVTLLDVLDGFEEIPVCVGYRYRQSQLTEFPQEPWVLDEVQPVYERLPGWLADTTRISRWEDLPQKARDYVERLAEWIGAPVGIVSIGPDRTQFIRPDGSPLERWFPE
jgi:adenylosuccinate synthase